MWLGSKIGLRGETAKRTVTGPAGGGGPSPIKRPGAGSAPDRAATGTRGAAAVVDTSRAARSAADVSAPDLDHAPAVAAATAKRYAVPGAVAAAGVALLGWAVARARRSR